MRVSVLTTVRAFSETPVQESVLELEYIESVLPPEYVSAFEHDDWVSDVSLARSGCARVVMLRCKAH